MKKLLPQSLFIAAFLFLLSSHAAKADYNLNILNPYDSIATDINDAGEAVGNVNHNSDGPGIFGFLWQNGQVTYLDFYVAAINNSEQIVGESFDSPSHLHPILWQNGTKIDLPILSGFNACTVRDINDAGQIVGECYTNVIHSVIWQNGQIIDLGVGQAMKINSSGEVVGNTNTGPVVWQNGIMQNLSIPTGQTNCSAYALNDNGDVTGGCGTHAYLWQQNGQIIDLGIPAGTDYTYGYGINNSGQIIINAYNNNFDYPHTYVWQNGNLTQLPEVPATYPYQGAYAIAINNLGAAVGWSPRDQAAENDAPVMWSLPVVNTAPVVGNITPSSSTIAINTALTASGTFTDDAGDTHTAVWDWGDNSTSQGTVTEPNGSTPGSVAGSHTYAQAGVYTVTLTVTDNGNLTGSSTYQYISAYNPTSQGLFSAGQHYTSPAGDDMQNPSATGTVKFGLSYKYQGSVPTGNKEFMLDFKQGNLTFNATTVSSLVTASNIGTLRGTGTINGSGTFSFLVTGDGTANTVRIQIKDQANNVIYDTQPGAIDTAAPTTTVTGNVIVHN